MGVELGMGNSKFGKVGASSRLQALSGVSKRPKKSLGIDSSSLKDSQLSLDESLTASQTLSKDSEFSGLSKPNKVTLLTLK